MNVPGQMFFFAELDKHGLPRAEEREKIKRWCEESVALYPGFTVYGVVLCPHFRTDNDRKDFREEFMSQWDEEKIRVLCLTDNNSNRRMWDGYAGGHTGFALGFRRESEFLSINKNSRLRRVMYDVAPSSGPPEVSMWRRWLVKHIDYEYESEFRALYPSEMLEHIKVSDGRVMEFIRFRLSDLSEVVVGHKAGSDLVKGIRDAVGSKIPVRQCRPARDSFDFVVEDI